MKKVLAVVLLLCVIGFAVWKYTRPTTFTVELRDKRTIKVTDLTYTPEGGLDRITSVEEFTLHNDIGKFDVRKDLQDIKTIQTLDDSGLNLKVTYLSGHEAQGNRKAYSKEDIYDFITGQCDKIAVHLPVTKIVSITRD